MDLDAGASFFEGEDLTIPVGVDFGTSNCAAAIAQDAVPRALPLDEGRTLLPSVLYVDRSQGRQGEDASRSMAQILLGARTIEIGEGAIRARIERPEEGVYFKSPKRFLGSELRPLQRAMFQNVIAAMLSHIRQRCEDGLGIPVSSVVLGRPVTYSDTHDAQADAVAIETMRLAAIAAGFNEVRFLMEPVAAALEFERSLRTETLALIVDAGGGTTDCSVVRLGPERARVLDRAPDVLSFAGCRAGGVDIDEALAWRAFTPLLGRDLQTANGRPLPYAVFHEAVSVHDLPAQTSFYASEAQILRFQETVNEPVLIERLLRLCRNRRTDRLVRSAELAKIELSEQLSVEVPLLYLAEGLGVTVGRSDVGVSAERAVSRMIASAQEAVRSASVVPDVVFVTGGTARSPVVADALRSGLGIDVPLVVGDLFGSVASGLALHAERVFAG